MLGFARIRRKKIAVHGPIVWLVYERTTPFGTDSGVEPLIAVCATEEEAEQIKEVSSSRGRYGSWEKHPLQGAADRTSPLVDGEIVQVVLLGGGEEGRDPIGVAVYTDREAAVQRAVDEIRENGDPDYHAVPLPIGWRGLIGPQADD